MRLTSGSQSEIDQVKNEFSAELNMGLAIPLVMSGNGGVSNKKQSESKDLNISKTSRATRTW